MKCDRCDNEATIHELTINSGQKVERHLCESCARDAGFEVQPAAPISQLITKFVMGAPAVPVPEGGPAPAPAARPKALACGRCQTTFAQFKSSGLLGCPDCYRAFEAKLAPLLERAHGGGSHHVGKVPRRALAGGGEPIALLGDAQEHADRVALLRRQLDEAVQAEQYERAAKVRDELRRLAGPTPDRPTGSP